MTEEHIPSLRELFGLGPTRTERIAKVSTEGTADIKEMLTHPVFSTLPPELQEQIKETVAGLEELAEMATEYVSAEQEARDILERMEIPLAQLFSSGDLVELANLISEHHGFRNVLTQLVSEEECDFDHHGNCQMHNWFGETECPHAVAKRLLQ